MNIQVYCDESGLEALTNKSAHSFVAIGGIWMPSEFREQFKLSINELKKEFGIKGEVKWQKVSYSHVDFYKKIIDYFFKCNSIRFRVILIEASRVNKWYLQ
jgi:hypothetical protein